ncbi:uncharacterized protein LOC106767876 [Vigna radiata var. radiata]|uniref:Uncharacterized protein LOC106767876 n=1 Tax=Vigna radiata var. radiata TaxID=3916 RepID=A0A1S3UQG6_VIGRR|nr:uncharacterized protein LOC106767876 [Vigna radiata var. radiata]
MEAYSSSFSSSNSSYLTQNPDESKGLKLVYPLQSHNSWLHSVRKPSAKPRKKAPVAPMPPTPAKVYKVEAINFRDVVQQLTGAPEHQPQPRQQELLQSNVARAGTSLCVPNVAQKQNEASGDTCKKWYQDLDFGTNLLSPTSYSTFCFFPLLSPRDVTSLEAGKVL